MNEKIQAVKVGQIPFELKVDESIISNFERLQKAEQEKILLFAPNMLENLDQVKPGVARGLKLYNVDDAMIIFQCERDKALRTLKYMFTLKLAIKLGKEYLFSEKDLFEFYELYKGMTVNIT